ncbi:hypothetical protein KCP77_15385 [Salmonella enterica subsp. enterica]|nr:hypothetical protein KCP77_15385 [Salmonella enterica subsp. enterica]
MKYSCRLRNTPRFKATPEATVALRVRNTGSMCLALTFGNISSWMTHYWATSAAVVSFPTVGGVISKVWDWRIAGVYSARPPR